ncbi:MAG: tetratricopeptide repeat protein [Thermoguttaceae bacterium]|nr:tetratricopeptide repeat protein [Thermoguttaceae bacterium]
MARLAAQKPLPEVEAKVDALLRQSPDDPVLLLAKADLAIRQGRLDAGIEQLERVDRLEPASPAGPYFKALALLRFGQQDRAATDVSRALARDPKHLPSLVLAARVALAKGDPGQALTHAQAALALRPGLPEAVLAEAEALRRMDRTDEARRAVEDLIAQWPNLSAGYAALAALHAAAGRTDEALEAYRRGLEKLPNHPALRLGQIALLARSNRVADAQEAARQAVGENPKAAMLLAVARVFAAEGRLAEARQWCDKALAAGDAREKTAARFLLGNVAVHEAGEPGDKDRLAEARDHFAAVVAAEPGHLIAANNLAWLLATEFGQAAEAVAVLEKAKGPAAVRQLPAAVAHTLAVAYRKAGRADEAMRVLDEALAVYPDDAALLIEIGAMLAERQRWIEARSVVEKAKKIGLSDQQSAEAGRILATIETSTASSP